MSNSVYHLINRQPAASRLNLQYHELLKELYDIVWTLRDQTTMLHPEEFDMILQHRINEIVCTIVVTSTRNGCDAYQITPFDCREGIYQVIEDEYLRENIEFNIKNCK